jgi:hypothetical protein
VKDFFASAVLILACYLILRVLMDAPTWAAFAFAATYSYLARIKTD